MTKKEYRKKHSRCRLLSLFPQFRIPTGVARSFVAVPHWDDKARELHHIIPRSIAPKETRDDLRNLIHLHPESHRFVTEYGKPGLVLCIYAKWEMGELDSEFLSKCMSKNLVEFLCMDDFVSQCQVWDWLERYRQEIVSVLRRGNV